MILPSWAISSSQASIPSKQECSCFAHSGKNIRDDGGPSGDAKLAERYLSASLSCSGMSLVVDILQLLLNDMSVYLCGGDIRMAQHLLNGSAGLLRSPAGGLQRSAVGCGA